MNIRQSLTKEFGTALHPIATTEGRATDTTGLIQFLFRAQERAGEILDVASDAKRPQLENDRMRSQSEEELEAADALDDFQDAVFLWDVTTALLKYSIEDEGVELRDEAPLIASSLVEYLENNDPKPILSIFYRIVKKQKIVTQSVIYNVPAEDIQIVAKIPSDPDVLIPVSSSTFPIVPVLEETLADPLLCEKVVDAYSRMISVFLEQVRVDHLCFVEKSIGPVGAIGLLTSLVVKNNVSALIYRQRYFAKRGKLSGHSASQGDNVVLIYDLIVSGQGLRIAAEDLKSCFGINVVGAVVLLNYSHLDKICTDRVDFPVLSLSQYEDIAQDVEKLRKGMIQSNMDVVPLTADSSVQHRSPSSDSSENSRVSKELNMSRGSGKSDEKSMRFQNEEEVIKYFGIETERAGKTVGERLIAGEIPTGSYRPNKAIRHALRSQKSARQALREIGISVPDVPDKNSNENNSN